MLKLKSYVTDEQAPAAIEQFNREYEEGIWLTIRQAIPVAGRNYYAIAYQIRQKRLPVLIVGNQVYVRRQHVEALWPDEHRTNYKRG